MKIDRFQLLLTVATIAMIAEPAFAGRHFYNCAPAPVAGLGIGAAAAFGAGYRALKRRFTR